MKRFAFVLFVLTCLISCKTDLTDIENHITEVEEQGQALDNKIKQLKEEGQQLSDAVKELQRKSEDLQKKSEELQKKSKDLVNTSDELEKASQVLKDSLESLRKTSLELAAELISLQKESKVISDSLDVLRTNNDLLVEEWNYLQQMITQAQETIEILTAKIYQTDPKLIHMEFLASENPLQLVEDAECEIIGDSAIECRVLNVMSTKSLIPRFRFTGDYVTIGGQEAISSKTVFDFSSVRVLVVHAGEKTKEYTVTVSAYTGLPTLWAETVGRTLKEANLYYNSTISLVDNVRTGGYGSLAETTGRIMAQGSLRYYTKKIDWSSETEWGKNDYKLSFSNAVSLLNMPAHKEWQLIPNVNDITMLHNQTAFFMGEMSALHDCTPQFQYVDLMFNGRYTGTYMLGECLKAVGTDNIDIMVDWYLINEIAKNEKGASGMVWDFETAFGNAGKTGSTGFVAKNVDRYQHLFQDPVFVAKVKERFEYFYNRQADIIGNINENAQYLKYAIQEDDTKWDTFKAYKSSNIDTWVLYQGQVSSMKSWLADRMSWLKEKFDEM